MLTDILSICTTTTTGTETTSLIPSFLLMGGVILLLYFMMIRPQKKKEKQETIMRKNLMVGDEVVTVGGVVGIVFSIKEDTVVIETGGDRSKIRIKRYAIAQNLTVHEAPAEISDSVEK